MEKKATQERKQKGQYNTPYWAIEAIRPELPCLASSILDPCHGAGRIMEVASREYPIASVRGYESDPALSGKACADGLTSICRDALGQEPWLDPEIDICPIIWTNPPYKLALEFAERALDEIESSAAVGTVAMLLRLGFLAGKARRKLWGRRKADVYVLERRPSFVDGRTDYSEYAWIVWGPSASNTWARLEVR